MQDIRKGTFHKEGVALQHQIHLAIFAGAGLNKMHDLWGQRDMPNHRLNSFVMMDCESLCIRASAVA